MGQRVIEENPRAGAGARGPPLPERPPSVPGYVPAVSGASAGLVAGIVVCPLDVVKTRLQIQGSLMSHNTGSAAASAKLGLTTAARAVTSKPLGILGTFRQIVAEEGLRGLYSGLTPLLVGYLPSWAIYFYVYKHMQDHMHVSRGGATFYHANEKRSYLPEIGCAVTAGACSTVATNPIWMIKTRMMAQSRHTSWRYSGVLDAARSIYAQEGLRAFYSGLTPALLGLPHVAIHFPLYEKLKHRWAPQRQWYGILAASIASKVVASTITYPHEVIRSRSQIRSEGRKYRGIWRTARTLWIEEGWRVFYAGLMANMCRAMPASAVTLLTFELVSHSLSRRLAPVLQNSAESSSAPPQHPGDPGVDLGTPVVDVIIQCDNDDDI